MKSSKKQSFAKIVFALGVVVIGFSAALIAVISFKDKHDQASNIDQFQVSTTTTARVGRSAYVPGLPQKIVIPKINVDAPIVGMGLTDDGDLDAPENIAHAGWYIAGPRAGSKGSAVIDGHYGGTTEKPAVFDNLHTLVKGDEVMVEDSDKKTHVFVVTGSRIFQPEEDARTVFSSKDDASHLNLITCQGQWVDSEETYTNRLVVFTDLRTD